MQGTPLFVGLCSSVSLYGEALEFQHEEVTTELAPNHLILMLTEMDTLAVRQQLMPIRFDMFLERVHGKVVQAASFAVDTTGLFLR